MHKQYFIISCLIYSIFLFTVANLFIPLYFLHIFTFVLYSLSLNYLLKQPETFYSKSNLLILISFFSFIIIASYKYISFYYNDNFFVFSEADALTYYKYSLHMAGMPFIEGIKYYLNYYSYDDLGAVLFGSLFYRFIDSIIILNFFYIICGVITALAIYDISSNFMSLKYAFLCATAYSLSSFILWFQSSGLKESLMCMLVVLFFHRYYNMIKKKNLFQFVMPSLLLLGLMLFRPAILFFCVGSVGISLTVKKRKGATGLLIMIIVFALFIFLSSFVESSYKYYTGGGDFNRLINAREADGMVKGGLHFTYAVNVLAQFLGPLPTISSSKNPLLSFFSAGLIYKVLLSVLFWFGVYYIYKLKVESLYPLIFFAFFEMVGLLVILEGLELRKSLPHFFVIYIIAFWFMDKFDSTNILLNGRKSRKRLNSIFSLSSIIVFFLILGWNVR